MHLQLRFGSRAFSEISDARLGRLAILCCVPVCLAYGVAGLVYGHLPLLTPFGFIDMPGACAWLCAIASFALATAATQRGLTGAPLPMPVPTLAAPRITLTEHAIQRTPGGPVERVMLRTTLPPEPPTRASSNLTLYTACLLVAAIALTSALAGRALIAVGIDAFARPVLALAPRSEWPLWPLPVVWPWLLPFARHVFVAGLWGIGAVVLLFCWVLARRRVRGAWVPLGVAAPLLTALAHLGSAGYDYAAARGLGLLRDTGSVLALASDPGYHNIYTFLSLWIALGCASVGIVVGFSMARAVVPAEKKKQKDR